VYQSNVRWLLTGWLAFSGIWLSMVLTAMSSEENIPIFLFIDMMVFWGFVSITALFVLKMFIQEKNEISIEITKFFSTDIKNLNELPYYVKWTEKINLLQK
jgi:hypothetical protein